LIHNIDMDRNKTIALEKLITDKLTKHSASTVQIKDGELAHFEITMKFRDDRQLSAAITKLRKLNP